MASTGTFFHMLGLFDKASAFTGSNWAKFKTEFIMTFQSDPDFIGVLDGTVISNAAAVSAAISSASSAPTTTPAPATPAVRSVNDNAWAQHNANGRTALWRCITSDLVRQRHIKPDSTATQIWTSLRKEYERDSRAPRISLKRSMMHAVHDVSQSVDVFIGKIVDAAGQLTAMGAPPGKHDVVDCIIVNLHADWHIIQTQLIARPGDLTLDDVRSTLIDWETQQGAIHGTGASAPAPDDDAHAVRRKPGKAAARPRSRPQHSSRRHRRQQHDSDSESSVSDVEDLNWGNLDGDPNACHRCGRHGHRARDCIVNMPRDVKDRIMDEVRNKNRERRKEQRQTRAHHHRRSPSSSSSSSDYSSSSASTHRGMYTYTPWHNHKVPRSVAIAVEG
ncbi:hypothetical protein AURDEDRAFT_170515 [Auricularia subglabra TFB-10046 SS5]|nr:hypothetical protein AURDEDRAFT_170515 [Auricularia subglabra TFB-10046 SS5]